MIERMLHLVRRFVPMMLLGGMLGCLVGFGRASAHIAANGYLATGMESLAARVFAGVVWRSTGWGLALASLAFLSVGAIYALSRILRGGDSKSGYASWVATVTVLAAYVAVGIRLNKQHLPGFFEPASIATNVGLTGAAFVVWYGFIHALRHAHHKFLLSWIHRSGWVASAVIVLICGGAAGWKLLESPQTPPTDTNVIVLLIDALRPDRLGAYGYGRPTSPFIDRLAAEGILFENAFAPASWTKPSIASLFTSLYPHQHGIGSGGWGRREEAGVRVSKLPMQLTTIAEVLANAGYETIAIGANHHLDASLGFAQGFDEYQWGIKHPKLLTTAPEIHRRLLSWLDEEKPGSFFAYLHYVDVHWPYRVPEAFRGRFGDPQSSVPDYNGAELWARYLKESKGGLLDLDEEVVRHMSDAYDELIAFVDSEIGKLMAELKARGLLDHTMVILTADHGEAFAEHGAVAHGHSLYDEVIRVPLIIRPPCAQEDCWPRAVPNSVSLVDIMPTVLTHFGLTVVKAEGVDVVGKFERADRAFSELGGQIAMRTSEYKYIFSLNDQQEELYALRDDPREAHNLAAERPTLTQSLRNELLSWLKETAPDTELDRRDVILDESALERLRTLGYIQ